MTDISSVEPGALAHIPIGLSVSDSPDLLQLGFTETHLRVTLGEIARALILSDAAIVYGGRIDPEGYTDFLRRELEKYSRRDQPMTVCLSWSEHRRMSLEEIAEAENQLGLYGKLLCLDSGGSPISSGIDRSNEPCFLSEEEIGISLTSLRRFMTETSAARILVGGRRIGYEGQEPGVLEEARLALEANKPLYLAGGFGGIAGDIAAILNLDPDHVIDGRPVTLGTELSSGYERLREIAKEVEWDPTSNGLTYEENCRLAVSHRPAEVASLIVTGLRGLESEG